VRACRMHIADNGSLVITSTAETDAAVYQCFAVNSVGETSATVLLAVFGLLPVCCLYTSVLYGGMA